MIKRQHLIINRTRSNFSFAWNKFAKQEVKNKWDKDSFRYFDFLPHEIYSGDQKLGLDAGCGSGTDMIHIANYAARVVGIDICDTLSITRANVSRYPGIYVCQANIYNLPFKNETFDFIYSFGVLHHLPDPEEGFRALCEKVKTLGYIIIYVYEDFSERSFVERFLLDTVNTLRRLTPHMPQVILYILCILMSPLVLLFCSIPYQVLKRFLITKKIAIKIPFRHTARLDCIVSDLYDRFSPPIEMRYNRGEVKAWFENEGFEDVHIVNYRGWVAWGKKP